MSRRERPIRVALKDQGEEGRVRVCQVRGPLRFGYGKDCDLLVDGDDRTAPDVLFELQRVNGPLRLYLPVAPEALERHAELVLNGRPLHGEETCEVEPGSRLEVVDKATQRRYSMVVEPRPVWLFRPRVLAAALVVVAVMAAAYGGYFWWHLGATRSELASTGQRLTAAESTERELTARIARLESTGARLLAVTDELERLQRDSARSIRDEFDSRMEALGERTRTGMAQISERDLAERERLAARGREAIEALRQEFAARMVEGYQRMKQTETELFRQLTAGMAALQPSSERFKQVLAEAGAAVVFLRTEYRVRSVMSEEVIEAQAFGSGFLVGADGLVLTSQHVLFPWRYDRELLTLGALELVAVVEDSVRWSLWPRGARVLATDAGNAFVPVGGYHSDDQQQGLRFLHTPAAVTSAEIVGTPMGAVTIDLPLPGPSDVAVMQVLDFRTPFPALALAPEAPSATEPLDEVLALGYPFSRLDEGVANPQGVHGFVRRVGAEALELDTALHPGLSGGPIVDRDGRVVAMAMAQLNSEVYGMAVRSRDLATELQATHAVVLAEERRLESLGCAPGAVDGHFDADTWRAYLCEAARAPQ